MRKTDSKEAESQGEEREIRKEIGRQERWEYKAGVKDGQVGRHLRKDLKNVPTKGKGHMRLLVHLPGEDLSRENSNF